jgi:hypothetical protein
LRGARRRRGFGAGPSSESTCHRYNPRSASFILDVTTQDDVLVIAGKRWIEIDPLLFVRDDGASYASFRTDSTGHVVALFPGSFWAFEKLH